VIRILHTADLHLDSPFSGLSPEKARERRRELRELPNRLADLAAERQVQLVLLAGDLFDGERVFPETVEQTAAALGRMGCPVFISPGNHDYYRLGGVYARTDWPENVHIFTEDRLQAVELPELNAVVYGAAFTGPAREQNILDGFSVPEDGRLHLMVLHGDLAAPGSIYGPIGREEAAASGLDCLCLGHVHHALEQQNGRTLCHYPGCPEGRGFDELGDCGVWLGDVEKGTQQWTFVPTCRRKYQILEVDVTGRDPAAALEAALPAQTAADIYRVIFTGESEALDLEVLRQRFSHRFYSLELRDKTSVPQDIWARSREDNLRGLFLKKLRAQYDAAETEEEREQIVLAVRFGLAALDGRDL